MQNKQRNSLKKKKSLIITSTWKDDAKQESENIRTVSNPSKVKTLVTKENPSTQKSVSKSLCISVTATK